MIQRNFDKIDMLVMMQVIKLLLLQIEFRSTGAVTFSCYYENFWQYTSKKLANIDIKYAIHLIIKTTSYFPPLKSGHNYVMDILKLITTIGPILTAFRQKQITRKLCIWGPCCKNIEFPAYHDTTDTISRKDTRLQLHMSQRSTCSSKGQHN